MSPILVRPVREQLEHDRVIRLLQQRWRRKYLVGINQGSETTAPVPHGDITLYPDVVLAPLGRPNKPEVVVEVETGESVNNLEAMAEWVPLAHMKAQFHLYIPAGSMERARRLCTDHNIDVAEIWTYHLVGDQMRFTPVYKAPHPTRQHRRAEPSSKPATREAKKNHPPAAARGGRAPAAAQKSSAKPAAAKAAAAKRPRPKQAPAKPAARAKKRQ